MLLPTCVWVCYLMLTLGSAYYWVYTCRFALIVYWLLCVGLNFVVIWFLDLGVGFVGGLLLGLCSYVLTINLLVCFTLGVVYFVCMFADFEDGFTAVVC